MENAPLPGRSRLAFALGKQVAAGLPAATLTDPLVVRRSAIRRSNPDRSGSARSTGAACRSWRATCDRHRAALRAGRSGSRFRARRGDGPGRARSARHCRAALGLFLRHAVARLVERVVDFGQSGGARGEAGQREDGGGEDFGDVVHVALLEGFVTVDVFNSSMDRVWGLELTRRTPCGDPPDSSRSRFGHAGGGASLRTGRRCARVPGLRRPPRRPLPAPR